MHINNLYKDREILAFRKCYAMEKIHGTSAHVRWIDNTLGFFSGGSKRDAFVALFNQEELIKLFGEQFQDINITVYGEAYGGKLQGMKETYGDQLRFIAFEVKIGDSWLTVLQADKVATSLGFEFVHWEEVETDIEKLDALRDASSVQAKRNGCGDDKLREGIVLRPPFEVRLNNDKRVVAKYKNEKFAERKHPPKVGVDLKVLEEAEQIADEWVIHERLRHVSNAVQLEIEVENIGGLIKGMRADVAREAAGEIVVSDATWKAIAKKTALMVKQVCKERIRE